MLFDGHVSQKEMLKKSLIEKTYSAIIYTWKWKSLMYMAQKLDLVRSQYRCTEKRTWKDFDHGAMLEKKLVRQAL